MTKRHKLEEKREILKRMVRKGMTREQIASDAGVSPQTITNWRSELDFDAITREAHCDDCGARKALEAQNEQLHQTLAEARDRMDSIRRDLHDEKDLTKCLLSRLAENRLQNDIETVERTKWLLQQDLDELLWEEEESPFFTKDKDLDCISITVSTLANMITLLKDMDAGDSNR